MAETYKNKGNTEYQAGNYPAAVENYTYAIEMEPKNHIYLTNRSTAYAAMKQWEKSLKDADKAIALKSDWAKVTRLLIIVRILVRGSIGHHPRVLGTVYNLLPRHLACSYRIFFVSIMGTFYQSNRGSLEKELPSLS